LNNEAVVEETKNKYEIRYLEGKKRIKKELFLEDLLQGEMEAVNILIADLGVVDTGDFAKNILSMNLSIGKKKFYPKLMALILQDEEGNKFNEEFYSNCVAKDLEKPARDFFDGEGSSMISGLAGTLLSPLLKLLQANN
jgi:hypothetical protein